jgi:hypothetical protein
MFSFEWDEDKAKKNFKKHGISFDEAQTVFYDDYARIIEDPDHSEDEDRFLILGFSTEHKLMIVAHCYVENEKIIRLISARKAGKNESKQYWSFYEKRI